MTRNCIAVAAAAAMFSALTTPLTAQTGAATNAQPIQVAQDQSRGAGTSGGATSGGATSEEPTPTPAPPAQELAPGPAAPPGQAEILSSPPIFVGAMVAAALVTCALACFGHASVTTTSTTATR